jgi:F0F1-type ATP synthase membrane subunit b/b'
MAKKNGAFPVFGLIYSIVAIPYNFFIGFVVGVAAPVAAIAAMVLGVRFLTGKMPFLKLSDEEERRLSLELVEQERAHELLEVEKEKIMSELGGFAEEMKALLEQAKATAKAEEAEEA